MPRPERWLVLTAHVAEDDPLRDLVAEGLLALGGTSVLQELASLSTYLPEPLDADALAARAADLLANLLGRDPPRLTWVMLADQDWENEWRRGLRPRKVSSRLVVKPTWTQWDAAPGETVIDIDPQMAFGTGEHATTRSCLRLIDRLVRAGDRVLDVGSGSAILAIAAARLGAGDVVAVEMDPDANLNARENLEHNGVAEKVRLIEGLADRQLLEALGVFDLVIANILSGVIRPLLPVFREVLAPGGRVILSGILRAESEAVLADAEAAGLRLIEVEREDEWWSAGLRAAEA